MFALCELCGHKSASNKSLKEHIATHLLEPLFSCYDCGMGFTRSNSKSLDLSVVYCSTLCMFVCLYVCVCVCVCVLFLNSGFGFSFYRPPPPRGGSSRFEGGPCKEGAPDLPV